VFKFQQKLMFNYSMLLLKEDELMTNSNKDQKQRTPVRGRTHREYRDIPQYDKGPEVFRDEKKTDQITQHFDTPPRPGKSGQGKK